MSDHRGVVRDVAFAPDGKRLAFVSKGLGSFDVVNIDGSGHVSLVQAKHLYPGEDYFYFGNLSWSWDGLLAFSSSPVRPQEWQVHSDMQIYIARADGTRPERVTEGSGTYWDPSWWISSGVSEGQ